MLPLTWCFLLKERRIFMVALTLCVFWLFHHTALCLSVFLCGSFLSCEMFHVIALLLWSCVLKFSSWLLFFVYHLLAFSSLLTETDRSSCRDLLLKQTNPCLANLSQFEQSRKNGKASLSGNKNKAMPKSCKTSVIPSITSGEMLGARVNSLEHQDSW